MNRVKLDAVFIDRDGTLGASEDVVYPDTFVPFNYVKDCFSRLKQAGIKVFIFSNQSCIARKKDKGYDFSAEFTGYGADDWFICPHDDGDGCDCRKPGTGLLIEARDKYGLDLSRCAVIGDRWSDMLPGGKLNMRLIPVLTGRGERAVGADRGKWAEYEPDYVAADFKAAVEWIVSI